MITSQEPRQKYLEFFKNYKYYIIIVFIVLLTIGFFGYKYWSHSISKTTIFSRLQPKEDASDQNNKYNYDLFFRVDEIDQNRGLMQSIWSRTADGKETELYNDKQSFNGSYYKTRTSYYADFIKGIPKDNRYAIFYLEDLVPSFYNKMLFFDKETKVIRPAVKDSIIYYPFLFSPDYKHLAVFYSDKLGQDQISYVDIIDLSTMDIINRYYYPKNYTRDAIEDSQGLGRPIGRENMDNFWKTNDEFQIAIYDLKKFGAERWREGNFEKHIISIKNEKQIKDLTLKSIDFHYGFDDNDILYVKADDGSYVAVKNNFKKLLGLRDDQYISSVFTMSTVGYLFVTGADGYYSDILTSIINKNDFTTLSTENIPKSLINIDWQGIVFSPSNEKIFAIAYNQPGDITYGEIIDLKTLKVLKHIDLATNETFDYTIHDEISAGQDDGPMDGPYSLSFDTKWIDNDKLDLYIYNKEKKDGNKLQVSKLIKIDLKNDK